MTRKPNYGVDRPDLILAFAFLGLVSIAIGTLKVLPGSSSLGYFGVILLAFAGVFVFGGRWKPVAARQLLNTLQWTGTEAVLDVGCGRGLWLVEAAKHLTTGRVRGGLVFGVRTLVGTKAGARADSSSGVR